MKKKRSLCAALLAGLMVTAVCLTGCGQKAAGNGSSGVDSDKVYQVGVCQLTQHDALDAATHSMWLRQNGTPFHNVFFIIA